MTEWPAQAAAEQQQLWVSILDADEELAPHAERLGGWDNRAPYVQSPGNGSSEEDTGNPSRGDDEKNN